MGTAGIPGVSGMFCSLISELLHVQFVKIHHNLCLSLSVHSIPIKSLPQSDWLFITHSLEHQALPESCFPDSGYQKAAFNQSDVCSMTHFPTQLYLCNKKQPKRNMLLCQDCVPLLMGQESLACGDFLETHQDTWKGTLSFPGCTGQSQQPPLHIRWSITASAQCMVHSEHISRVTTQLSQVQAQLCPPRQVSHTIWQGAKLPRAHWPVNG